MSPIGSFIHFCNQWLGSFSQVAVIFAGILLCVLIIAATWDKRIRPLGALSGAAVGIGLICHSTLIGFVVGLSYYQRSALQSGVAVILFLAASWVADRAGVLERDLLDAQNESSREFDQIEPISARFNGIMLFSILLLAACFLYWRWGGLSPLLLRPVRYLSWFMLLLAPGASGIYFVRYLAVRSWEDENGTARKENGWSAQSREGRPTGPRSLSPVADQDGVRGLRGSTIGAPLAVVVITFAVFLTGAFTPQAMIGDEVTHYYMMVKQAADLSQPNFYADVPQASGQNEVRRYPHSFGWHYLGAVVYKLCGNSFLAVQVYQSFFLFELLLFAFLLARSRGGIQTRSALLYILILGSLPLCLIFSVAFYQDVAMTAQALAAFYFLSRRRWFWGSCFMAFAIWIKVTAVIFYPMFFLLAWWWETQSRGLRKGLLAVLCSFFIVMVATLALGRAINLYAQAPFYPQEKLEQVFRGVQAKIGSHLPSWTVKRAEKIGERLDQQSPMTAVARKSSELSAVIIANHPGDLRSKVNFLVYGGIILWLVVISAPLGFFFRPVAGVEGGEREISSNLSISQQQSFASGIWMLCVGGFYLLITFLYSRTAPDARFFLPGLPFILLPCAELLVRLPKAKILIAIFAALALLQGGYVLKKAAGLRQVSGSTVEGIHYLQDNPPQPNKVFMYPEGNYRLFPAPHEWYLGYRLREFWRGDNDFRLNMLHDNGVGAVVVKKHLIAEVDDEITNLGVYPSGFVKDLENDKRFVQVFENQDLLIFKVPARNVK